MSSIQDTQKITNAMYLIASTKMRKAKRDLDQTRPYFSALNVEIKRVFRNAADIDSPFFYPDEDEPQLEGTYGCLVITADKGLAGAYNQNAIRKAEELLEKHPDTQLFVVGECGRQYFMQHHIPIEQSFLYTAQNPTVQRAREISDLVLERYLKREIEKFYIIYTDMKNSMEEETIVTRLLPFHRTGFITEGKEAEKPVSFEYSPSLKEVLDTIMPGYFTGFIYSALVASFCCEQNARMTAMNSANQNAQKMLDELRIRYNRVRQADITQEITEVSAGAKAQKLKRRRMEAEA